MAIHRTWLRGSSRLVMDMHTPRVAPKELRGLPCRLALDKGIFGYMVPITQPCERMYYKK